MHICNHGDVEYGMSHSMDAIVEKLIPLLDAEGISYTSEGSRIRIALPNNFGCLEIGDLPEGDTIIGLVDHDWHSHADVMRAYGGESDEESILVFLKLIFSGKFLLVEEKKNGETHRKYIWDDPEGKDRIYKYLEEDEEVVIHNETYQ